MKTYEVKVTCEYYVDVVAETTEEALELAVDEEYQLGDLQNFQYEVTSETDSDYYDDTLPCGCCDCCGCSCGAWEEIEEENL